MSTLFPNVIPQRTALILTDGCSPLGREMVFRAHVEGYGRIIFGAPLEGGLVDSELMDCGTCCYVDPGDAESLDEFAKTAKVFRNYTDNTVVVSHDQPRIWSQCFNEILRRPGYGHYFVGLSPIQAAEDLGIGFRFEKSTLAAKASMNFVTKSLRDRYPYLATVAAIPGILNVPELHTDRALAFRLLFGALRLFQPEITPETALSEEMKRLADAVGLYDFTPGTSISRGDLLARVLDASHNPLVPLLKLTIEKNADLENPAGNKKVVDRIEGDNSLHGLALNVLCEADIAIEPRAFAEALFRRLRNGDIPENRCLKIYSEFSDPDRALISQLLGALA